MSHTTRLGGEQQVVAIHNGDFSGPLEITSCVTDACVETTYDALEGLVIKKNRTEIISYIEQLDDLARLMEFALVVKRQKHMHLSVHKPNNRK